MEFYSVDFTYKQTERFTLARFSFYVNSQQVIFPGIKKSPPKDGD